MKSSPRPNYLLLGLQWCVITQKWPNYFDELQSSLGFNFIFVCLFRLFVSCCYCYFKIFWTFFKFVFFFNVLLFLSMFRKVPCCIDGRVKTARVLVRLSTAVLLQTTHPYCLTTLLLRVSFTCLKRFWSNCDLCIPYILSGRLTKSQCQTT